MANTPSETNVPRPKGRRWLKILGIVFALLIILIVAVYFVATSAAFLKGQILPRASEQLNADITVTDATISPFSEVVLRGLKLVPKGREPLLQADEVHLRYSLSDILKGNIVVHEVTINAPVVTLVQNADGSSNLDPLTKKPKAAEEKKPAPAKSEKPPQIDIKNVALKNAEVTITKNLKSGGHEVTQVSGFNFSVDHLQNGQAGKIDLAGVVKMDRVAGAQASAEEKQAAGSLEAALKGSFNIKLASNLLPESAQGTTRVDVTKATGAMDQLSALGVALNSDLTPTEIRNVNLRFEQNGEALGELKVSGPFSAETMDGHLKVDLSSIDRRVLNLVGGPKGLDFNQTKISLSNEIDLKQKASMIAVSGQFNATDLSLTQKEKKQTTPTLNLQVAYQLSVDQNKKSALIEKLNLSGEENQQKFLRSELSRPMTLSWGEGAGVPDAAFDLEISKLNLADWKAFAGDIAPSGSLNTMLHVVSKQGGKQLMIDLATHLADFSGKFGSNQLAGMNLNLNVNGQMDDLKKVSLSQYRLEIGQGRQPAATIAGSGNVNVETMEADVKTALDANIPELLLIVKMPNVAITSGSVRFDGRVAQNKDGQAIAGSFALNNLVGTFQQYHFNRLETKFDADVLMTKNRELQIRKALGTLAQAGQRGGDFSISGNLNLTNKIGLIEAKLADVNQNLLATFLAPSLGDKKLVSVSINANAKANLEAGGDAVVVADLAVTNLVVNDPKTGNGEPLSAQFKVDGASRKQVLDLRQFEIALSPTEKGKNRLNLSGQFDMARSNAWKGNFTARAESLDVTPFYDLYVAPKKKAATPEQKPAVPTPAVANSNEEPAPIKLPFEQASFEVNIGKFVLREIEITNLQTTAKIQGSHVVVEPLQLTLNGAPVSARVDADVSVPGYVYNVGFDAKSIPLEPLANSFMPEKRGAYKGLVIGNAKIQGKGMTGTNLRKNLNGQFSLVYTNAEIHLVNSEKWKNILTMVFLPLRIPNIVERPVNLVDVQIDMGEGEIRLKKAEMASDAFIGGATGNIPIADVLTNSPLNNLPVNISLSRPMAKAAGLIPANTDPNATFIPLPKFVTLRGTLGNPKPDVNKLVLGQIIGQSVLGQAIGLPKDTVKGAGNILGGVGNILGGASAGSVNTNTNAPPKTNQIAPAVNQIFDLFKKKK